MEKCVRLAAFASVVLPGVAMAQPVGRNGFIGAEWAGVTPVIVNYENVTGFGAVSPAGIRLNLSPSFGYSVAGGQSNYADTQLGYVSLAEDVMPEPSTNALLAVGLAALSVVARRRRCV